MDLAAECHAWTWTPIHKKKSADPDTYHNGRSFAEMKRRKVPIGRLALDPPTRPILLLYFDLETTGLNTATEAITQCSVDFVLMTHNGPSPTFASISQYTSFVHTDKIIRPKITEITGITQAHVQHAPLFTEIYGNLHTTIEDICTKHDVHHCIWVAHNGHKFDALLWARYLRQVEGPWPTPTQSRCTSSLHRRFWYADTFVLAKAYFQRAHYTGTSPSNYKLGTLASFFGHDLAHVALHRADADVAAMRTILEGMAQTEPNIVFEQVCADTYFNDNARSVARANQININTLIGIHGGALNWTAQQEAILHAPIHQHMCVIAGAGCAKTTTLMGRIMILLREGVPAHKIMLTTFSRDATDEMMARLTKWIGSEVPIVANTIDGLSVSFLKQYASEVLDECKHVSEYKTAFLDFLREGGGPGREHILQSVSHVLVDEYQDINDTYYGILEAFVNGGAVLTAVGDDAQSIYGWNGADIQHILEFGTCIEQTATNFAHRTYYLTQNFRSTPEIINLANQSIRRNVEQLSKTIDATNVSIGQRPVVHHFRTWTHESETILPYLKTCLERGETVAILCRNCTDHGPLYHYESQCRKHGLPCNLLERYFDLRSPVDYAKITLSTIHKSKGLEWDNVVVVGCKDMYFPNLREEDVDHDANLAEERRLFYVASTRAKLRLTFTFSEGMAVASSDSRATHTTGMTRFLSELPRSLFKWKGDIRPDHYAQPEPLIHTRTTLSTTSTCKSLKLDRVLKAFTTQQWIQLRAGVDAILQSIGLTLEGCAQAKEVHREHYAPDWLSDNHMHEDMARWLLHVIARRNGVPEHPLMHNVLRRMPVPRKDYFEYVQISKMHPDDWYNKLPPGLHKKFKQQAEKLDIDICEMQPSLRTNLPNDVRERLRNAYAVYCTPQASWEDILVPTFEVSCVSALERGRLRSFHQKLEESRRWIHSLQSIARAAAHHGLSTETNGARHILHYPVDGVNLLFKDELPLVCSYENETNSLHDIRLFGGWTLNDTVSYLIRMAVAVHYKTIKQWSGLHVYQPWAGKVVSIDTHQITDAMWMHMVRTIENIVNEDYPPESYINDFNEERSSSNVDQPRNASDPPQLFIKTEPWTVTVARIEQDMEC